MRLFKLFLVSAANAISFGMLPRKIQMSYIDIDEIPVYRSSHSQDDLFSIPTSGSTTMYELFQYSAAKFAKKNCFGQREILDTIIENKEVEKDGVKTIKEWKYLKMSEYNWYTFDEANSAILNIGMGFKTLNFGNKITLFAGTSRDWMIVAHAAFSQSITIATAYDTLGVDGLSFSLNEGGVRALFTTADLLLSTVTKVKSKVSSLEFVIYNGKPDESKLVKVKSDLESLGVKIYSLDDVHFIGINSVIDILPPKPQDIACIMYTSGSTGDPKGVILTHANLIAAISGTEELKKKDIRSTDVYIGYLPLAHILELLLESTMIYLGVPIGYATKQTLLDDSVRECLGDLKALQPTIMTGVPLVWEGIRKGIMAKVPEEKLEAFTTMINLRYNASKINMEWLLKPATNFLAFNKAKAFTGGKLRFALSGGAPINPETQKFISIVICPVIQGFGMTETTGLISVQNQNQYNVFDSVGVLSSAIEMKLKDVVIDKVALYSITNDPPQGEIWVRGPSITQGYYNQPTVTKETIDENDWLRTGDVGELQEDGTLRIIDRIKNLVKLSGGEYVALEKLEVIYRSDDSVNNLMVYASSLHSFAVAVVLPKNLGVTSSVMLESLLKQAKGKLANAELIKKVLIVTEDWTPENGLLTSANKLNRKAIFKKYEIEINALFAEK